MARSAAQSMEHPHFGSLTYDRSDKAWRGVAALPRFASLGIPAPAEPVDEQAQLEMLAQAEANIKNRLLEMMRKVHGDKADEMFAGLEAQLNAPPLPAWPTESNQPTQGADEERESRFKVYREGRIPIQIDDPDRSGPTIEQEAALQYLLKNEEEVVRGMAAAMRDRHNDVQWDDQEMTDSLSELTRFVTLDRLEFRRENQKQVSYVVVRTGGGWDIEHGVSAILHPAEKAQCMSDDEMLEFFEAMQPPRQQSDAERFLRAIEDGDFELVKAMRVGGSNINRIGDDPLTPLSIAVHRMDVNLVKRLLTWGADPMLKAQGHSALDVAKSMLSDLTPQNPDPMWTAMMADNAEFRKGVEEQRAKLEEMLRLMQAAQKQ